MIHTFEAIIDEQGQVRLLETVNLPATRRALVTVLDEEPAQASETALLSEASIGRLESAGGRCRVVTPAVGSVVLVPFPFSDLSEAKLRPAVALADAGRDDWILCQVTTNPYGDPNAIEGNVGISDTD